MNTSLYKEFWKQLSDDNIVMASLDGSDHHSEPMHAHIDKDDSDYLWVYTKKDNRLAKGGLATLQFVGEGHDFFASLKGSFVEELSEDIKDKFWSNPTEAWFENGRDDAQLIMLRFKINSAEIWEKDASIKGMLKLAFGSTIHNPEEVGNHTLVS